MSPNPKNEKQVQFYDHQRNKISIHGQALASTNRVKSVNHVGRSNSAITQQTKVSSSKLRRHAKSEPISSNKETLSTHPKVLESYRHHSLTSSSSTSSTNSPKSNGQSQKRPTFLPLRPSNNDLIIPSATSAGELPGAKINSSPSSSTQKSFDQSLIDENRRLRYRLVQMERRESQFTSALDKLQADYSEMNGTCQKRFRIEEKKLEAMEYAMKQLTLENDKLKRELNHHHDFEQRRRESPNSEPHNSWQSNVSSNSLKTQSNSQMPLSLREGDFAGLDSVNILLNALRERDSELKMLKMLLPTQLQKQVADYVVSPSQAAFTSSFTDLSEKLHPSDYPISGVITPPADFSPQIAPPPPSQSHQHEYK